MTKLYNGVKMKYIMEKNLCLIESISGKTPVRNKRLNIPEASGKRKKRDGAKNPNTPEPNQKLQNPTKEAGPNSSWASGTQRQLPSQKHSEQKSKSKF